MRKKSNSDAELLNLTPHEQATKLKAANDKLEAERKASPDWKFVERRSDEKTLMGRWVKVNKSND